MVQTLIQEYGYLAVLAGTFIEGEAVLVLGGLAAKLGYLELPWVMLCAFIGTVCGDQFYFFLGRYRGQAILARYPWWRRKVRWVNRYLERHQVPLILGFRFLYGIRMATPFVLGMSRIKTSRFIVLHLLGVAVWVVTVSTAGYLFGRTLELLLGDIQAFEMVALGLVVLISLIAWFTYNRYRRDPKRAQP